MKNILSIISLFSIIFLSFSCTQEDDLNPKERLITSFKFAEFDEPAIGVIDNEANTITVEVRFDADLSSLTPTIEVSERASVSPASGVSNDFRNFALYTVTGSDGAKKVYTVLVTLGESGVNNLREAKLSNLYVEADIDSENNKINFTVPFGSDLTNVVFDFELENENATSTIEKGSTIDLSSAQQVVITAPNGDERTYEVNVNVGQEEVGVRGVWFTNVDSQVLNSRANIKEAVDLCKELNINTIFVVTLNKAMTTYPSNVMKSVTGVEIDPTYSGRDPLRELIDEAHAQDIKVMAWFEYGFAANNGSPGPILNAKPEWAAINTAGGTVVKNGFYWMNALLPDVQDFMIDLVMEVVENYPDIDGIQGDDRLPAMPSEGGYDSYTVTKYRAEHDGQNPPTDTKNSAWLSWRANILNEFAVRLYNTVKEENPDCIVAMSPSPLNFGLVEYLQDWPAWIRDGACDIVSPQLYRRDNQGIGVYRGLLGDQLSRTSNENAKIFYPGILTFLGSYVPDEWFLAQMIQENRRRGVMGEVHFFYPGLIARKEVFKALYPAPAVFPDYIGK